MARDFQKMYQEKLRTAEEAVKLVKSGDWIDWGMFNGKPVALDKALAARKMNCVISTSWQQYPCPLFRKWS